MQGIQDLEEFLDNAKKSLQEEEQLKAELVDLETELAAKNASIESERKALKDQIDITIKARVSELTKTYDDEYSILTEKLKRVKSGRERAKNQGIKERIADETKDLSLDNKNIKQKIKDEMKKSSVPFFANTHLFMSVYMPSKLSEILTLLLSFAICYIVIPLSIFYFIPWNLNSILKIIIIYLITIIIFGGTYILVANISKYKYAESLKIIKGYRKDIDLNNKKIEAIKKEIKSDKNEEKYNLASFDDDISHIEKEIQELIEKRDEAINTFESVTKNIIVDELTSNSMPRIDFLETQKLDLCQKLKDTEVSRKSLSLKISNEYEVYLGKDLLSESKIVEIENIIKDNTISNLSEAIEIYKTNSRTS